MTRVAIVTDSSADLPPQIAATNGITVIPVAIRLGADAIREPRATEGRDHRQAVAWETLAADREPELSDAFFAAFSELGATYDAIVAVLLSSRLGTAVEAASQASARLGAGVPVEIVDSRSVSLGLGYQALRAAQSARQGTDAAAIASELRAAMDRYHVVFSIESVEHLRRSGQIGRAAAMIAEALQLKPLLRIDEGQIVPYERARTRTRAITELAEFVRGIPAVERCAVLHASNWHDANRLLRTIAEDTGLPPDSLTVTQIGDAVASHVGPGALGVAVVEYDADVR